MHLLKNGNKGDSRKSMLLMFLSLLIMVLGIFTGAVLEIFRGMRSRNAVPSPRADRQTVTGHLEEKAI